ncbi:hypothetical protein [Nocardioides yefusunii]|uniref:WD40 repeat domain-containing protein n=1 Tax=Nocardioides yefusunii TaxID=2500546 RepID=A0ABW1QXB0_9ACTN|nr:hypothetical protein [Nocardioides yefusunii]
MKVASKHVAAGTKISLTGKAKGARTVTVDQYTAGRWKQVKRAAVTKGVWKVSIRAPKTTGAFKVRVRAGNVTSRTLTLKALKRTKVTLAAPASMNSEDKATFTGRATKAKARTVVKLQRKSAKKWVTIAKARTNKAGRYTIKHTPTPGATKFRAVLVRNGKYAEATSKVAARTVKGPSVLKVVVSSPAAALAPLVNVYGPNGFHKTISETTTFPRAAGDWQIAADWTYANDFESTYWANESDQRVKVAKSTTKTVNVTYGTELPTATKIADSGDVTSVQNNTDSGAVLTTPELYPGPIAAPRGGHVDLPQSHYEVGDIIVSEATPKLPNGLLARVTAVSTNNDGTTRITVTKKGVKLTDAAPTGAAAGTQALTTANATNVTIAGKAKEKGGVTATLSRLKNNVSCKAGGKLELTGDLQAAAEVGFETSWHWKNGTTAKAHASVDQEASLIATATGNASCELKETALLKEPYAFKTFTVWAGPIPIVMTPKIQLLADAQINTKGDAEFGYRQDFHSWAEMNWNSKRSGNKFQTKKDIKKPTLKRIGPNFEGSADFEFAVTAEPSLILYGLTGPTISVRGALTGDANVNASAQNRPQATIDAGLYFGLGVSGRMDAPPLDISSGTLNVWDNFDSPWKIWSGEWEFGTDAPGTGSLTNITPGTDPSGNSYNTVISGDGKWAAWGAPVNKKGTDPWLYLRELKTGKVTKIKPTNAASSPSFAGADNIAISNDGKWIAYNQTESNLGVWLYDRVNGTQKRIDAANSAWLPGGLSITDNGDVAWAENKSLTWESRAQYYTRTTGTRAIIPGTSQTYLYPGAVDLSADGSKVAVLFISPGASSYGTSAAIITRATGKAQNITTSAARNRMLSSLQISADGTVLTYVGYDTGTYAFPVDPNYTLYKWKGGTEKSIVTSSKYYEPENGSFYATQSMSKDGRYVAYLAKNGTYGSKVEVVDTTTNKVSVISRAFASDGNQTGSVGNGNAYYPSLTRSGARAVFTSSAKNLSNDTDGKYNVYLWDMPSD